jgi:membrane-associated HD superfamily phosphohydrolase
VINAVTAKDAAGHIASVNLEDDKGKVIVKAGATITAADAKKLASVKDKVTWPVKAKVTSEVIYLDAAAEEMVTIANSTEKIDENGYF